MLKPTVFLGLIMLAMVAFAVFEVEHKVQSLRADLSNGEKDIRSNQERIRVLKAEWSYLNQPARLKTLAAHYLSAEGVSVANVQNFDVLPYGNSNTSGVETATISTAVDVAYREGTEASEAR